MRLPILTLTVLLSSFLAAAQAATLQPYADEAELTRALERWRNAAQALRPSRTLAVPAPAPVAAAAPAAMPAAVSSAKTSAESTAQSLAAGSATPAESITNVQTTGVDEGGIVKRAGDYLVILRRGRLFTVRVGADQLQPVAMVDAYAPGIDPRGTWYDELLVAGSTVVVVGYSPARGGTEIGLFELGADGGLAYRATYQLRSDDYYSSRNFASRLLGTRLVFYTPSLIQPWADQPQAAFPALRRWDGLRSVWGRERAAAFERILPATRVYRTDDEFDPGTPLALHTVTTCELGQAPLRCESTAVLGPVGRVFHVSAGSVYVWTTASQRGQRSAWAARAATESALFRLPLDGAAPSAIKTSGVPVDALSFLEDAQGHLNVLLREAGDGEGMWRAEHGRGRLALLRLPLAALGDGRGAAALEHYQRLGEAPVGALHNRYVGDWLLWGGGEGAWALRYAQGVPATRLQPGHAVERIEALGEHALLVGNAGSELRLSGVQLRRGRAQLVGGRAIPDARQGETRTHGFFYRAIGTDEGLLGLPVVDAVRAGPGHGAAAVGRSAAGVVFLRQRGLAFTALGSLDSQVGGNLDDGCKASCVDWYGNARPIFTEGRVLALLGYELVEGRLDESWSGTRLQERRRISLAPAAASARGTRPWPFD